MCGLWKTGDGAQEIDIEKIEYFAANLATLGTQALSIGGGEPFLRSDLPGAVEAFIRRGIEVRVLTNGLSCPTPVVEDLFARGLRHISISLDTLDRERQALICGREDIWERAEESISLFSGFLRKFGGLGVINVVVSRLNIRELADLVEFAGSHGFHCSFVPLELQRFAGRVVGCKDSQEDMEITEEDYPAVDETYRALIGMKKKGAPIFNSTAFLNLSSRYARGMRAPWPCRAGSLFFSVDPSGNFSPCHREQGLSGEAIPVYAPDFPRRFRDRAFRAACRAAAPRDGRCCLRPCWAEVALATRRPSSALEALALRARARRNSNA
jgi:MoaA/NifB/PqqE/SkfB family radical SAM enzyme